MIEMLTGPSAMRLYAYLMIGAAALTLIYTVAMQAITVYKASRQWLTEEQLEDYRELDADRRNRREARRMAGLKPDADVVLYRDLVTSWKQDRAALSTAELCLELARGRARKLEAEVERQGEELSRVYDANERLQRQLVESEEGLGDVAPGWGSHDGGYITFSAPW